MLRSKPCSTRTYFSKLNLKLLNKVKQSNFTWHKTHQNINAAFKVFVGILGAADHQWDPQPCLARLNLCQCGQVPVTGRSPSFLRATQNTNEEQSMRHEQLLMLLLLLLTA